MVRRFLFFTLLFTGAFAASLVVTGRVNDAPAPLAPAAAVDAVEAGTAQTTAGTPAVVAPAPVAPATTLIDFSRIAERTVPAVVNISAQQIISQRVYDPWAELFGRNSVRTRRGVENSLGSGVIVSRDGYILTNNHVVTGESSRRLTIEQLDVTVALSDGREMRAEVIGTDRATDLALLKVDASDLPTMPWGDSSALKVAEWVLAIGNPYQLSETVTLGIVSAVNRTNLGVSAYEDFVQTDAAINPGNSGGALVNARGELIGINTVIFSQSGGYQGIGFAVSSNLARRIFSDLRQYGEVRRGSIGLVRFRTLTTRLADQLGAPDTRGALVYEIDRASVAYRAGVQPGDVVVAFNGAAVVDPGHLDRLISDTPIGSTAVVRVLRDGRAVEIRVRIERRTA
jgi:Do/DeqQ family serine protease